MATAHNKAPQAMPLGSSFGPAGGLRTRPMRVRLVRPIRIKGEEVAADQVLTLPPDLASQLIGSNKAVRLPDADPAAAPGPAPA